MKNQLTARKNEVIAAQEKLLKASIESKTAWTAAQETEFQNLATELTNIENNLVRVAKLGEATSDVFVPEVKNEEKKVLSPAYCKAFWNQFQTKAPSATWFQNAALSEGGTAGDGSYLVPTRTDPSIPALAVIEASGRNLSTVITTEMDIKLPYQATKTVASAKAESTDQGTHAFGTAVPTFATTTLSAYMAGDSVAVSWELLQDVGALAAFVTADLNRAVYNYEEDKFINGSGSGEPLGYLNGVGTPRVASLSIDAVLDLTGDLRKAYYIGAKFLMNRQTFIALLKAQVAANQFQTFVTFDPDGTGRILGYEVEFSSQMPVYAASPAVDGAILFGDFKQFAVIGDRGGSAIRAKVLDQVAALNGQTIVLGYRRTDQRVILQEAVKALTING